jgi:hypothetical protein
MAGKKAAPKKKGAEAPKLSSEEELARSCAELESVRRLLEIRTHEVCVPSSPALLCAMCA